MNTDLLRALEAQWREEAVILRRWGAAVQAEVLEGAADAFDRRLEQWAMQGLTVAEAANESGYSADHLREMVRSGTLPDGRPRGSKGRIFIRRRDLPRKPPERASADDIVDEMLGLM